MKNCKGVRSQNVFLILLSGIVGFLNPLVVTWDGFLYLGSGQAISNNLMESQYHWLREPMYPLILSLMQNSMTYRVLIVVQTILIMLALLLWSSVLEQFGISPDNKYRLIVILGTFSFLWGFGGTLLLQPFWIFFSALLIYMLTKWCVEDKKNLPYIAALLVLIQLLSSVFFFCTTLAVSLIVVVKKSSEGKGLIFSLWITFLVFIPSLTSFGSWEIYKNSHSLQTQIYEDSTEFWSAYPYNGWNIADKLLAIPSTFLSLNSMGVEFYQAGFYPSASESRGFGMPTFNTTESCGRIFPGPQKYIDEAQLPDISSCVASNALIDVSVVNKIIKYAYPFVVWIGLFHIVQITRGFIVRRNFKLLSLILFLFLIQTPYLISNAAISRLGIPTTLAFVFVGLARIVQLKPIKFSSLLLSKKNEKVKQK